MHDAGAKTITAETLPEVIEYLKRKNYVFIVLPKSLFFAQGRAEAVFSILENAF